MNIKEYENLDVIPTREEYPDTAWGTGAIYGDKYGAALAIPENDQEAADIHLWMLVGYSLRHDVCEIFENHVVIERRPLKWKEAFASVREHLAWRAFAKDIGDWALYSMVDGQRVERTTHRDLVWKLFKARLPERITGRQDDILERVHIKRAQSAKAKGQSYWRKGHTPQVESEQPQEPSQGALF